MTKPMPNGFSELEELNRQFLAQTTKLIKTLENPGRFSKQWVFVRRILDAMALGTSTYDVAVARLNNAFRYIRSGEPGPAKYELRLLVNGLSLNKHNSKPISAKIFDSTRIEATDSDSCQESGVC